jgi:hypothetical protein
VTQDHLAHDFDGNPGSRRIRGSMPPQIMRPQFDPGQLPGVLDDDSCCSIGDWENPVIRLDCLVLRVRAQTLYHLSRNEDDLSVFASLWTFDRQLVVADILRCEL